MKPVRFCTLLALLALFGCQSSRDLSSEEGGPVVNFDTLVVEAYPEPKPYRASETRLHDLLHTELHVRFNWDERQLLGQARLTVRPYFFEQNQLVLDARGFDIHRVALARKDSTGEVLQDLAHDYANHRLTITLDRTYHRQDTFTVFIDYTANPYKITTGGSAAITSDRGLYFINADGSDPDKPQQIWTQGETEANSAWFPTIDAPNERMTQTVYITVEDRFKTLSNGKLVLQVENQDGTRTDCWQQELPHAPYLTMMAIGEYAIIKDTWRDKEVHYYVEQEYAPHARKIFGNTPEMLSFYSRLLGVDYPWDKYHQVVVRDYVSGAMENTSAVIFG
ncbi:MAG: M1 family aminopeptidase, partial [Bacteroidota bacterium]